MVAQLALGEAFGGEPVDDAEGVAELVVEERALHAARQRRGDVGGFLADLVPGVGNDARRRVVTQVDHDDGLAGAGVAVEAVEVGHLLKLALQPVGEELGRVRHRGTRPEGGDDHGLDGEGRILVAAEAGVAHDAADQGQQHQEEHQRPLAERPGGEVEAAVGGRCMRAHRAAPSSAPPKATFCPGRSLLTPAVTTWSPSASPEATITCAEP